MRGALAIYGIMCKGEIQNYCRRISLSLFWALVNERSSSITSLTRAWHLFSRILTSVLLAAARLTDAAAFVVALLESLADASPCVAPQSKHIAAMSSDVVLQYNHDGVLTEAAQ